ncbi:PilT/PilU family type 4a pilus ATPase [Lawsonibacter sp. OA9]|uniref:type IV pilus twitching motility protein PilT n=1 Tax=Oscillospiraceae TaxID=216572 RepID=UPI001F05DF82|nr:MULTISPECIES: PilT/PilU family type 4a pilus ATPase [Oscillospiraceae]MCH1978281.1 PilT/PilU family type 4a pilus ATPase [Lawsonibacter sp. OA9]MCH1981831.1 PilT/PilU family type 4a pilus ATPase [Ruminococcus sp. OA3]
MTTTELLHLASSEGASDIFIVAGLPLTLKTHEVFKTVSETKLTPADTETMIREIYKTASNRELDKLFLNGDDDFSFSVVGLSRFRVNAYRQRGSYAAVIRVIAFYLPRPEDLHIPENIIRLADVSKGMVLLTGPAGCGKSTTLSCMVDHINNTKAYHIITLEDPLEFLHSHKKSIVSQREINTDTQNYLGALRAALRQNPNVILLGEMRDYETIHTAMTAAETGHLVLSSLHTIGASNTIDRIIDVFPSNQQQQIAVQLSMVLQAVVSQQLVPAVSGGYVPAFEIMTLTPAIHNLIRSGKVHQIEGTLYSSATDQMISMDNSLLKLYQEGTISSETALHYATNPEMLQKKL